MYRNCEIYLKDILSAIESIEKFVKDMDFEKFERDDLTSSAVIRKFEIIGEATKNIPDEIREKFPQIIQERLPELKNLLGEVIKE